MRIVALLAVRNEQPYMERCLRHLHEQGIETCVIDNESTDATRSIAESFRDKGVFHIETFRYQGYYDWVGLLARKQELAAQIEADWFIHHDADEIRESPEMGQTLAEGIHAADADGFNAVNFDEFVFLPADADSSFEGRDYYAEMEYYYHFEPAPYHRVNAWKRAESKVDLVTSGGHSATFEGRLISTKPFVLRHYIMLSRNHGVRKYVKERTYAEDEVRQRGWHGWRPNFSEHRLNLPPADKLCRAWPGKPLSKHETFAAHRFVVD
ncbi:MAG: glycosyltransferase family 2 protein [Hyphomicrobium sp.]|jgi:glycosyltransferase involved in cell wall biosynthesis